MPQVALRFRHKSYLDDHHNPLQAWRGFVTIRIRALGGSFRYPSWSIVDSGAPFSVIPYSTWNQGLDWNLAAARFTDALGNPAPELLEWFGEACDWGETGVELFD